MKKTSILFNISILISTGLIVKILGMLNKIIMTRVLGVDGISMYSLMMPTVMLLLGICSFSLSSSIQNIVSTNISKKKYSNRDLIIKCFILSSLLCTIVSLITLIFNYSICHYLLKMDSLQIPFLFFIPMYYFSSWGGVLKGYYHGHNKLNVYAFAQALEQVVRISFSLFLILFCKDWSLELCLIFIVISLGVGEFFQFGFLAIYTLFFTKISNKTDVVYKYNDFFISSFTLTINRLISSISYFFEPIVFTFAFSLTGMSSEIATRAFGILHGYVIPLIVTGSFVTTAIQQSILPPLNSYKNDFKKTNSLISKSLFLSFIPGLLFFYVLFFYSSESLFLVYGTDIGSFYLKILAISGFIGYFDGVFSAILLVYNKEKTMLFFNIFTSLFRLFLIFIFVQVPSINALGLPLAYSIISIIITIHGLYCVMKITNYKIKLKSILMILISILSIFFLNNLYSNINSILDISFVCIIVLAFALIYYKFSFKSFQDHLL